MKTNKLSLNRWNKRFWQLLILPVFTFLYMPLNRYIMLPRFGSGEPYVDMQGNVVTHYFSANTAAAIIVWVLMVLTALLSVRNTRGMRKSGRIAAILFCILFDIFGALFFFEFTLWN